MQLNNISTQATLLAGSSIAFLGGEALETVDDFETAVAEFSAAADLKVHDTSLHETYLAAHKSAKEALQARDKARRDAQAKLDDGKRQTEKEKFEYLWARKSRGAGRSNVQEDPVAAVLSFQRRSLELKTNFLRSHLVTPLGISEDTFDRTEAQKRQALHAHILWWAKRRKLPNGYVRMPPVPTPEPGGEEVPQARPRPPEKDRKEDHP